MWLLELQKTIIRYKLLIVSSVKLVQKLHNQKFWDGAQTKIAFQVLFKSKEVE